MIYIFILCFETKLFVMDYSCPEKVEAYINSLLGNSVIKEDKKHKTSNNEPLLVPKDLHKQQSRHGVKYRQIFTDCLNTAGINSSSLVNDKVEIFECINNEGEPNLIPELENEPQLETGQQEIWETQSKNDNKSDDPGLVFMNRLMNLNGRLQWCFSGYKGESGPYQPSEISINQSLTKQKRKNRIKVPVGQYIDFYKFNPKFKLEEDFFERESNFQPGPSNLKSSLLKITDLDFKDEEKPYLSKEKYPAHRKKSLKPENIKIFPSKESYLKDFSSQLYFTADDNLRCSRARHYQKTKIVTSAILPTDDTLRCSRARQYQKTKIATSAILPRKSEKSVKKIKQGLCFRPNWDLIKKKGRRKEVTPKHDRRINVPFDFKTKNFNRRPGYEFRVCPMHFSKTENRPVFEKKQHYVRKDHGKNCRRGRENSKSFWTTVVQQSNLFFCKFPKFLNWKRLFSKSNCKC